MLSCPTIVDLGGRHAFHPHLRRPPRSRGGRRRPPGCGRSRPRRPSRRRRPRASPAPAARPRRQADLASVTVHRGGPDATIGFHRSRAGEVFLNVTVSARGVSWADRGNESAVVSAYVDGHYATDIVITSAGRVARQFALGSLRAGRHTLRLHYAARRSPSDAGVARLQDIGFTTVRRTSPAYAAAQYAPVLYGRNVAGLGGRFQNNRTDTPLIAWHQVLPAAKPGHSVIEYSVLWSNEDGGTAAAGADGAVGAHHRHRVDLPRRGRRPGPSGAGQRRVPEPEPRDAEVPRSVRRHPSAAPDLHLQQQRVRREGAEGAAARRRTRCGSRSPPAACWPPDQPREHEMDIHPWTYQVMGREMVREHKVESPSRPVDPRRSATSAPTSTSRSTHDTAPLGSAAGWASRWTSCSRATRTTYTSNHEHRRSATINRNGPAATTVELPVGTTAADIKSISVRRVAVRRRHRQRRVPARHRAPPRVLPRAATYMPGPSFAQRPPRRHAHQTTHPRRSSGRGPDRHVGTSG